jgi:hypothetical protein
VCASSVGQRVGRLALRAVRAEGVNQAGTAKPVVVAQIRTFCSQGHQHVSELADLDLHPTQPADEAQVYALLPSANASGRQLHHVTARLIRTQTHLLQILRVARGLTPRLFFAAKCFLRNTPVFISSRDVDPFEFDR